VVESLDLLVADLGPEDQCDRSVAVHLVDVGQPAEGGLGVMQQVGDGGLALVGAVHGGGAELHVVVQQRESSGFVVVLDGGTEGMAVHVIDSRAGRPSGSDRRCRPR
jgi:hypothetical protein